MKVRRAVSLISLVICLLICSNSKAQKSGEELYYGFEFYKKNLVHFSVAPDVFYMAGHVFYERMFFQRKKFRTFFKIGYGANVMVWAGGFHGPVAELGFITGPTKHHFELNTGTFYRIESDAEINDFIYAISIGYRLQKPNSKTIFRTGIGYPEGIYLGFGIPF